MYVMYLHPGKDCEDFAIWNYFLKAWKLAKLESYMKWLKLFVG